MLIQHFSEIRKQQESTENNSQRQFSSFIEESDSNMFFDSQIEGTVAKLLSSKSKSRNFLGH